MLTFISTVRNIPSLFLKSLSLKPLYFFYTHYPQLTSYNQPPSFKFNNINTFKFSTTTLSDSSKIPLVYHLKKHAQQLKLKSGSTSNEYLSLLQQLSIVLLYHQFVAEAVSNGQQMIRNYLQAYNKLTQKNLTQQSKRIFNYQFLLDLYKSNQQFDKYFSVINELIASSEKVLQREVNLGPLVIDLYLEAGITYYELQMVQQSLKMLEIGVTRSRSLIQQNGNRLQSYQKLIKAKNIIGHIWLEKQNKFDQAIQMFSENLFQIKQISKRIANLQSKQTLKNQVKANPDKNQIKESDDIKQLKEIMDMYKIKEIKDIKPFEDSIIANCILLLAKSLVKKLPNISCEQTQQALKDMTPFIKFVENVHSNKILQTVHIQQFYQNLATIYIHTKEYNKALESYRNQKIHIEQNQLPSIALSYQNQAKVHQLMKKPQKSIQKLNKSLQKRQEIYNLYFDKKRKTPEQQKIFSENSTMIFQLITKLIDLYKAIKNNKKAQQIKIKYQNFLNQ